MDFEGVQRMVREELPETGTLEYKAGAFLGRQNDRRDELLKEVLGFANADGGRLVIGISTFQARERKHLPEKPSPVFDKSLTAEWLYQVINTNSFPRFSNVSIETVACPDGGTVFVVDVRAADTAHQAPDHIYYQRAGLQTLAMSDFQIRDVMNRRSGPSIDFSLRSIFLEQSSERHVTTYVPKIRNVGNLTLQRWRLAVEFPQACVNDAELSLQAGLHARRPIRREHLTTERGPYVRVTFPSSIFAEIGMHELHPGDVLELSENLGVVYQVRTIVERGSWLKVRENKMPIRWRLSSVDAQPIEGEIAFQEWCRF